MTTFNKYLEDFVKAVKASNKAVIESLHTTASSALELNSRQRDAIMSRCTNYLADVDFSKNL